MKQIPFYKGIKKKVIVSGPSIIPGQTYKCVVFSVMDMSDPHTIYTTAVATAAPHPEGVPSCAPTIGTVTFTFSTYSTAQLQLGDNNLAVYDVLDTDPSTHDDEYTMYRVYEAKVHASDSIANHEQIEVSDLYLEAEGVNFWLIGGRVEDGYLILNRETLVQETGTTNSYLKLRV